MMIIYLKEGGDGSGNFGHAGRPGEVGGSLNKSYRKFPDADFQYIIYSDRTKKRNGVTVLEYGIYELQRALQNVPVEDLEGIIEGHKEGLLLQIYDYFSNSGRVGEFTAKNDTIRVATKNRKQKDIDATIRHEVGHRAQLIRGLINDPEWNTIVDRVAISSNPTPQRFWYPREVYFDISQNRYSSGGKGQGYREYFAEAYSTYFSGYPENLKDYSPEMYDYFARKLKRVK